VHRAVDGFLDADVEGQTSARPPSSAISRHPCSFSSVRPVRITVAPSAASSWATQRPMPLPPPVTQCTSPANRPGRSTLA
jgi:hypothetical protein